MVLSYPMNTSTFRPGQLSVDTTGHLPQKYFEEDDSILDDSVLDHNAIDSGLEMSPPMADSRRDSFALGSTFFSPKQEDWQPVEMQSLPTVNPFADQSSTNPFLRMDHQQQQRPQQPQHHHHHAMPAHLGSWPMTASTSAASGVATPVAHFDGLSSDFDSSASVFQRGLQTPFVPMGGLFQTVQTVHGLPGVSTAATMPATTSAVSVPMQLSSSNDSVDTQSAMVKRLPPQSPMMRSHNDMRRGDGIRKKNSRFDIPPDRNLNNIDKLISKSTDEQEIKELKQQKRLLRNRQAALDSRQRKKLHTERLEDEKKHYTSVMSDMEQTINDLRLQVAELQLEKQNFGQYIDNLNMDKEEMIRQHTIETAELRKKVSVLTGHIQVLESTATPVSALPSHVPGYTGTGAGASTMGPFGDMGGLGMEADPNSWDNLFHGMPSVEQPEQQLQQVATIKPDPESREATTTVGPVMTSTEKSDTQGGLLFMLFLVGAFVMSNRQMPTMPPVSDEIRVASAVLLDNVLKDASMPDNAPGASIMPSSVVASASVQANVAAPSVSSWAQPTTVEPSMLGQLSDQLMQTTEEQANEQLFSLNAAQYSGVVNYQHPPTVEGATSAPTSQGRRNLADALAAMRSNSKAEVYTRSLLWDQIPSDVVRSFVKMVSEVNTASPGADGEQ
ncbi:hypothetical protein SBRCBS47491_005951 [Sporothrix bragantina]|uniref:BZIP domain-containing protein n=1 Tax=Sporothrix bragantina TaxID=671064 RepID=A0ABP0C363_9PEZI